MVPFATDKTRYSIEPIEQQEWLSPEWLDALSPDPASQLPKVRQLYLALYHAITEGRLSCGVQLPASRVLASRLGLGRNTVVTVYQQLLDERLVCSDGRRGTRVVHRASAPPQRPVRPGSATADDGSSQPPRWPISRRAGKLPLLDNPFRELAPGEPDAALFPTDAWRRANRVATRLPPDELGYRRSPLPGMQAAIARYLSTYRSMNVSPGQILITASTRQSLLVAASLYADPGDCAWLESPGYPGAVQAFVQQGLALQACPIDGEGMQIVDTGVVPRLIYLTPCFQYPTGVALSATRRQALLGLSGKCGSVIVEDDYDSEFRDDSQPRPALASSPGDARVLHAGTFSKIIFPAARVAWLVLPKTDMPMAQRCLRALGGGHNTVAQAVVAELLDNGSVARHLQRARQIYAQRRERLVQALRAGAGRVDQLQPANAGAGSLSLIVRLPQAVPLRSLEEQLVDNRLGAVPLERFRWDRSLPERCEALVLGLGNVESLAIDSAVSRLYRAVETSHA